MTNRLFAVLLFGCSTAVFAAPVIAQSRAPALPAWVVGATANMHGNYAEAQRVLTAAAAQGDAKAIWILGNMHLDGHGFPKDKARALTLYREAAEAGEPGAMMSLAQALGWGDYRDDVEAAMWWKRWAKAPNNVIPADARAEILAQHRITP